MQSAKLVTALSDIAGRCWTLAGDCVLNHRETSRETYERRTKQWRAIAHAVVELDRELTTETLDRGETLPAAERN